MLGIAYVLKLHLPQCFASYAGRTSIQTPTDPSWELSAASFGPSCKCNWAFPCSVFGDFPPLACYTSCACTLDSSAWRLTAQRQNRSSCMWNTTWILHLCCSELQLLLNRQMEGGREKKGEVFCASPPPHSSKGEMSVPKGGKNSGDVCAKPP